MLTPSQVVLAFRGKYASHVLDFGCQAVLSKCIPQVFVSSPSVLSRVLAADRNRKYSTPLIADHLCPMMHEVNVGEVTFHG